MDFLAIFKVFGLDAAAASAADADAGTILDSGQAPPLTPRDGICRKGKPLAPTIGPNLRLIAVRVPFGPFGAARVKHFYFLPYGRWRPSI